MSTGLWFCKKCGAKWAGGAYVPRTELNRYFSQVIVRK
ncbi:MAG: hypothetical protein QXL41_04840 [Desulfurococcaceae archaeon]